MGGDDASSRRMRCSTFREFGKGGCSKEGNSDWEFFLFVDSADWLR